MKVRNKKKAAMYIGRTLIPGFKTVKIDINHFNEFKKGKAAQWYIDDRLEIISEDGDTKDQELDTAKKDQELDTAKKTKETKPNKGTQRELF